MRFGKLSRAARETLLRPSVISVLILVALWNFMVSSEAVSEFFTNKRWSVIDAARAVTMSAQLTFYQLLSSLRLEQPSADNVRLVYIDDFAHWRALYGNEPTSRSFLAKLVRHAAEPKTKADVIVLDFEFYAPLGEPEGSDDPARRSEDADLLKAICYASSNGVRVIMPIGLVWDGKLNSGKGGWKRLAGIFKDSDLPLCDAGSRPESACARLGFINLPRDPRQIPLRLRAVDSNGSRLRPFDSLALAAVRAYRPDLAATLDGFKGPAFGTFAPESKLERNSIAVDDLEAGLDSAKERCSNRIVFIGGKWRSTEGYGALTDVHESPVGEISGVALHADYLEALLHGSYRTEVPLWTAIVIDLFVGILIYSGFHLLQGWRAFLYLTGVLIIPPLIAYLAYVNVNLYLDLVLPIELYFIHLVYEVVRDYFHLRTHRANDLVQPGSVSSR